MRDLLSLLLVALVVPTSVWFLATWSSASLIVPTPAAVVLSPQPAPPANIPPALAEPPSPSTTTVEVIHEDLKINVPVERPIAPPPDPLPRPIAVDTDLTMSEEEELLALHNAARRAIGVSALQWSPELALSAARGAAKLKARGCVLDHTGSGYGENVYYSRKYGSEQTPRTPQEVMQAFMVEKKFYDPDSNTCDDGKICGHYTQIVWENSTEVGCAKRLCITDEREEVWVCQYDPGGNIEGLRPY